MVLHNNNKFHTLVKQQDSRKDQNRYRKELKAISCLLKIRIKNPPDGQSVLSIIYWLGGLTLLIARIINYFMINLLLLKDSLEVIIFRDLKLKKRLVAGKTIAN